MTNMELMREPLPWKESGGRVARMNGLFVDLKDLRCRREKSVVTRRVTCDVLMVARS